MIPRLNENLQLNDSISKSTELEYQTEHSNASIQKNPCYEFIMQLAHRIKILETNSSKVMVDGDYLLEEKPEVRQQLCTIDEKSEVLVNLRHDVNSILNKVSSLEEQLNRLEFNQNFLFEQSDVNENNIKVIHKDLEVNFQQQKKHAIAINNLFSANESLKESVNNLERKLETQIQVASVNQSPTSQDIQCFTNQCDNISSCDDSLMQQNQDLPLAQAQGICCNNIDNQIERFSSQSYEQSRKTHKPVAIRTFPCILHGDSHDLNDCPEFFSSKTKFRVERRKQINFRHCTICLQSNNSCRYKTCYKTMFQTILSVKTVRTFQ